MEPTKPQPKAVMTFESKEYGPVKLDLFLDALPERMQKALKSGPVQVELVRA